jgi:glycosyltransferase involved in cell wall biosynthesis
MILNRSTQAGEGSDETQGAPDIVCLSHLRWNFVFQRPQHLMTRLAAHHRVFFVEEPRFEDGPDHVQVSTDERGVRVVVPVLAEWRRESGAHVVPVQGALLHRLLQAEKIRHYVLWYYTPMAMPFSRHLAPAATVYDCMDELSGFSGAPPELRQLESDLLARADLVTTGGRSLYEAKRSRHHNVHAFPSSIDVPHFAAARAGGADPADQAAIPRPRIGFAGVIDERMDVPLIARVAERHPTWQMVLLGPVAKIDPASLPRLPNIHYLGMKPYAELPAYLAGWDVGMLPFAHNAATRFISPTKTPEYLAAGLPVVATSIRDVVDPYGDSGLARIADEPEAFAAAIAGALQEGRCARLAEVDALLSRGSWDETTHRIRALMMQAVAARQGGVSDDQDAEDVAAVASAELP